MRAASTEVGCASAGARGRGRRAFSLPEVLVASFVMAVLMLPVMLMFLSSAGSAGQDVREVRATLMAQEILEQVIAAQRHLCAFSALPPENAAGPAPERELDLDARRAEFAGELGFPLFSGKCATMVSRLYLSDPRPGFKRYLSIWPERAGRERGFLTTPALFKVTARVRYTTPLAAGEISKDVRVSTFLATDPGLCEEPDE